MLRSHHTLALAMDRFRRDLETVFKKLCVDAPPTVTKSLRAMVDKLIRLHETKLVKINHSVMELVVAKYMLMKGYKVDVEHPLEEGLVCDVYCSNEREIVIIEIETGFVPPENALDPVTYRTVRVVSKIARYSLHADRFGLATPIYHLLQIPLILLISPKERQLHVDELKELKVLCDRYYKHPPIGAEDLKRCKLDFVLLVNVDRCSVIEMDAKVYFRSILERILELELGWEASYNGGYD